MKFLFLIFFITANLNAVKYSASKFNLSLLQVVILGTGAEYLNLLFRGDLFDFSLTDKNEIGLAYGKEISLDIRNLNSMTLDYSYKTDILHHTSFNFEGKIIHYISSFGNAKNPNGNFYSFVPMIEYHFGSIYIEHGLGFAILDNIIVENRNISTQFQFNDNIGIGVYYKNFKIGYRFTHSSNLYIKKPNPGIDFHQIRVSYIM